MQIKRFEARSMSEALKMIKKEFGEQAVILSARNNRPGRAIFSRSKGKGVVVTAAVDHQAGLDEKTGNKPGIDAKPAVFSGHGKEASTSPAARIIEQFRPITPTGQRIWRIKSSARRPDSTMSLQSSKIEKRLIDQGLDPKLAANWSRQLDKLLDEALPEQQGLTKALGQLLAAQGLIYAGGTNSWRKSQGLAVVVGPAGSGKTTAVAQMAIGQLMAGAGTSAMITLDHRTVAGAPELIAYGRATGIKVLKASDGRQLRQCLERLAPANCIYVDTPALKAGAEQDGKQLRKMLAKLSGARIYLVLNAVARRQVMEKWLDEYRHLGPEGVILSHLDECPQMGHALNVLVKRKIPLAFLGHGPRVPEDLTAADAQMVSSFLLAGDAGQARIYNVDDRQSAARSGGNDRLVANRNSDIFHRVNCKAVQRINQNNMVFFSNRHEAMDQGFKPCRMCCSELVETLRFRRELYAAGVR